MSGIDSSVCSSATGAKTKCTVTKPQCTITPRCQHYPQPRYLGPAAWHSIHPGTP